MIETVSIILLLIVFVWVFWSKKTYQKKIQNNAIDMVLSQSIVPFLEDMDKDVKDRFYVVGSDLNIVYADAQDQTKLNQPIQSVLCPSISSMLSLKCEEVFKTIKPSFFNYCEGADQNYYVKILPFTGIQKNNIDYALLYIHDISMIVNERERRIDELNQLISVLMALVDSKDEHTKKHTELVALFSKKMAHLLKLDTVKMDQLAYASALLNFGKILVPSEILTKDDHLTKEEKKIVHEALRRVIEALKSVELFSSVCKILSQTIDAMEDFKKNSTKLSKEARLLFHVNAFIALISTRHHRHKYSIEVALEEIFKNCSKREDKEIYDALVFYLNDAGGRSEVS